MLKYASLIQPNVFAKRMRNTDLLKISHGYLLVLAGVTLAPIKEGHCFLRFLRLFLLSFCLFFLTRCIAPANSPAPPKPYTLQVGDRIDVTVEGYSEYSKQIVLRLDGFISYPLIGEIHSEGLTIPELESAISEGLAERLDNPRVFVTLVGSRQRSIYVWGTVQLASRYLFETEQIYLLQALAMAGGPDYEKAKLTEIQIWRGGKIHCVALRPKKDTMFRFSIYLKLGVIRPHMALPACLGLASQFN